jgi:hypothetical protein
MDKIAQFVLIAKRILQELGAVKEAVSAGFLGVQKQVKTIAEEHDAENEREPTPPVLRAELQVPEAIQTEKRTNDRRKERRERWSLFVAWATLFSVVAYAIINYHMLGKMSSEADAAKRSADTSRDALVTVQRAFINFSTAISIQADVPDPKTLKITLWEFSVPFENSGDTPTRGASIHTEIYPSRRSLPDDFGFRDATKVTRQLIVVGPKAKMGTGHVTATPAKIKAVHDRKGHLYIYGWCRYRDIFQSPKDIPHITKFCYELDSVGGDPFSALGEHNTFWVSCPHHNCTDDECKNEEYPSPP